MKKFARILLTIAMSTVLLASVASAEDSQVKVKLNGQFLKFDQPPVIIDGRTLVPLRAIFEGLSANVKWDNDTQTVTAYRGNTVVRITVGDNNLYVDNVAVPLDVPAQIIGNRTLVPIRAVSTAFGGDVGWDGDTQTVTIENEFLLPVEINITDAVYGNWYIKINYGEDGKVDMDASYNDNEGNLQVKYDENGEKEYFYNNSPYYDSGEKSTGEFVEYDYKYDEAGRVIYKESSNGDWEKYAYDESGNRIYHENSDGYWEKFTYGDNRIQLYYENSDGFWEKHTYNASGYIIYHEKSDGFWEKFTYDDNGNRIHFENSDGIWKKYEYDENGNRVYFENSDGFVNRYITSLKPPIENSGDLKYVYYPNSKPSYFEMFTGFREDYICDDDGNLVYAENSNERRIEIKYEKVGVYPEIANFLKNDFEPFEGFYFGSKFGTYLY